MYRTIDDITKLILNLLLIHIAILASQFFSRIVYINNFCNELIGSGIALLICCAIIIWINLGQKKDKFYYLYALLLTGPILFVTVYLYIKVFTL